MATNYQDNQNTASQIADKIAMIQDGVANGYTFVDLTSYGFGMLRIPTAPSLNTVNLDGTILTPVANT